MEYRKLPHGEERISVLGLGSSSVGAAGEAEIAATVELALEQGVNFFDLAAADAAPFYLLNKAVLLNDVKKGQPVTLDDVDLSGLPAYELYLEGLKL